MNVSPADYDHPSAVYGVLASPYRREVLRALTTGEDEVVPIEDLIEDLIDHDETADDRNHIAIKLHHMALPKLAEAGFIDYDARTQTARVREWSPNELEALTASVEGY